MKKLLFHSCISLLIACSTPNASTDEEAIKNIVQAFQADFNEGSFKHATEYTTNDWVHINPGGGLKTSRESTLEEVRAVHQSFLKGVTMTTDSIIVKFISADVALAIAIHQISPYKTPDGTIHENERQIKSYIMIKQQGKWLLTLDQNTSIQDPSTKKQ